MGVYLYGCGGIGIVALEVALSAKIEVLGFIDDNTACSNFCGYPVIHSQETDYKLTPNTKVVVCLGDNVIRKKKTKEYTTYQTSLCHTSATISPTAIVGEGTMVFHRAIVQANAKIGSHVILNTGASIDHDCDIGNFVHVAPNTTLCGYVKVGEGANIGAGAVVIPSVSIGSWSVIGAGAVVINDVPPRAVVVGNPARVLRYL